MKASATIRDFRLDINGLRAWAVAAVVLFHFDVPGFKGGFVGVDMFFVISGFLMTGIVVKGLEQGRFSLGGFYMARVRRIVPALVALCAALLTLGWWLLTPTDYKVLGSHAASSLAFLSNFKYYFEHGYFDATSHEKWLLHTWSLSLEWQFYMLLPLALMVIWKLKPGRRPVLLAMALATASSYLLCAVLTPAKPPSSFFLLHTRSWEMLAGGLVFLVSPRLKWTGVQRRWVEGLAWALALACILGLEGSTAWPGWRALGPVLATALILAAARPDSAWTRTALAQWLGTRSYSIYLWHWPVAVALLYLGQKQNPLAVGCGLLTTLLLGHLSHRWVELPTQSKAERARFGPAPAAATAAIALAAAGLGVHFANGIPGRLDPAIELMSSEAVNKNPRRGECHTLSGVTSASCMYGGPRLQAVVLGDSHADSVVNAVAAAVADPAQDGVMQWSYSSCPTVQGARRVRDPGNRCGEFVDWAIGRLRDLPPGIPVIIVNRHASAVWGENGRSDALPGPKVYFSRVYSHADDAFIAEYSGHLVDTVCRIAATRPVYLVRPIPEMGLHVPNTARAMVWGRRTVTDITMAAYRQRNDFAWAAQDAARERCGARILDPLPYLCSDGVCHGAVGGRPLYYDDEHMSESGNRRLVPMFKAVFEAAPAPPPDRLIATGMPDPHPARKP